MQVSKLPCYNSKVVSCRIRPSHAESLDTAAAAQRDRRRVIDKRAMKCQRPSMDSLIAPLQRPPQSKRLPPFAIAQIPTVCHLTDCKGGQKKKTTMAMRLPIRQLALTTRTWAASASPSTRRFTSTASNLSDAAKKTINVSLHRSLQADCPCSTDAD